MKKCLILAAALLAAVSCATWKDIPEEMDSFVDKAEIKAPDYTQSDWEESKASYQELVNLYTENFDKFSSEEKALATNAMGRYHALLVKNGLVESAEVLTMIKNLVPQYINGFTDMLKANQDEIVSTLESILDLDSLGESLEGLGEQLGTLFEDILSKLGEE